MPVLKGLDKFSVKERTNFKILISGNRVAPCQLIIMNLYDNYYVKTL